MKTGEATETSYLIRTRRGWSPGKNLLKYGMQLYKPDLQNFAFHKQQMQVVLYP